jgi:hypothetical protein
MGQKRTLLTVPFYVCFTPESGHLSVWAAARFISTHPKCDGRGLLISFSGKFASLSHPSRTIPLMRNGHHGGGRSSPTARCLRTGGPVNRFGAILFVEKEGFMPLFEAVKLANRYDLAIMSTKGMSVTAARELVDELCGEYDVPLLVLRDFDKSGFSIVGTLSRDTRRYAFNNSFKVIDLGFRLSDVGGLQAEGVYYNESPAAVTRNLKENGATDDEVAFLLKQRVELNAMTSPQLVAFIERKLTEHGIKKLVPDDETLEDAYKRMRLQAIVQAHIDELIKNLDEDEDTLKAPDDLRAKIEACQAKRPELRWDAIVKHVAGEGDDEPEEADDEDVDDEGDE